MTNERLENRCTVAIYGSCVSRDVVAHRSAAFELTQYVARQSMASIGRPVPRLIDLLEPIESSFQRRQVHGDIVGDGARRLLDHPSKLDLVLIDLIDERGGIVVLEDGCVSKLAEFWRAGGQRAVRGGEIVPLGDDRHYSRWCIGLGRLIERLAVAGLIGRTVVLRTRWATITETGDAIDIPSWMTPPSEADRLYERYFDTVAAAGLHIETLPSELAVSTSDHQWGPSPFHYGAAAREYLTEAVLARAAAQTAGPPAP